MRLMTILLSLACATTVAAQTKTKPRAASPTTTTLSITVTDGKGAPLSGVDVRASGPVDRDATTESGGTVRLEGLRSGTYRFRFTRDGYITLERDITVPSAQRLMDQHVMLNAGAKPVAPAAPPPAPEPAKPQGLPPPGKPATLSVPDFIEKNFIQGSQPQKVSPVACSGLEQTVLWQIREPWENRQHAGADAMLYVIGGEGSIKMDGRDIPLQAGSFVSVPRGTGYALTRRGRNPLIVLATLAGEPCVG